jgi:BioD-like phosphotransacetylase family protein
MTRHVQTCQQAAANGDAALQGVIINKERIS